MRVHRVPLPPPKGEYFRSYTNLVLANGVLLFPSYSEVDPAIEEEALNVYRRLLPGWKIVPIKSDALVERKGLLHCLTLGIPHYIDPEPLFGWGYDPSMDPRCYRDTMKAEWTEYGLHNGAERRKSRTNSAPRRTNRSDA
jgi:hypothetical protein